MSEQDIRLVYITTSSEEEGARIASAVVEERLAACANIVPRIRSIYRWQGKVEDEAESLILMKTRADTVQSLMNRVRELHTYDVPDIVAIPIKDGHPLYVEWILENTTEE
ncbi:MAG: divalent-cation tolerance protein CutA [Gemmatimonadetes bacterium]|nr:divalent-cation tolerance protein CutA [Gemmatimonadota bacterium]|tara:strand:- start:2758 stop:3087 length:330 start_codon:yes stop_codon:yes gene_type:complete